MRTATWVGGGTLLVQAALAPTVATAADVAVSMTDLVRNVSSYVGKRVVISDCLMISANSITGAVCSVDPINAGILVNVDADTWTPEAKRLAGDCSTAYVELMCVLRVTGEVTTNGRAEPVIIGASLELVKRTRAI